MSEGSSKRNALATLLLVPMLASCAAVSGPAQPIEPPPQFSTCGGEGQTRIPTIDEYDDAMQPATDSLRMERWDYPDIAIEAHVEGVIVVRTLICANGRVLDTQIRKSVPMLDARAIDVVRRHTFRPATRLGAPVASWRDVPLVAVLP